MRLEMLGSVGRFALAGVVVFAVASPTAAEVRFGGQAGEIVTHDLEVFADFAGRPGTPFSALYDEELGITFGEKLVGQVLASVDTFDVISGTPSLPLEMDTSFEAEVGIHILTVSSTTVMAGLGELGFPWGNAIGEGALTVLYARDQRLVGFDLIGVNDGAFRVQFFNRSGDLLDDLAVPAILQKTYLFGSDDVDIAAITVTNTDFAGMGFDNFRYSVEAPVLPLVCNNNGPYMVERQGGVTTVLLAGAEVSEPDGMNPTYRWITNCPGGVFDDETSLTPVLSINTSEACTAECTVTLTVEDGFESDICSTEVTIVGDGESQIECPEDLTVEADGSGNLEDLENWLYSYPSDDPTWTSDFDGLNYECGEAGSVTVTWSIDGDGGGDCGGASECSATFTIVDTTPPLLEVDTAPLLLPNEFCEDAVFAAWPDASTSDDSSSVTADAPEMFTAGETTTVNYLATDDCGNTSTASVEVTVLGGAGVEVLVDERTVGRGSGRGSESWPLSGVMVEAYDVSTGGCARDYAHAGHGLSVHSAEAIVADCEPVGTAMTDQSGVALVDVPPGQYVVIAGVDRDLDGLVDNYLSQPTGNIQCGKWKTRNLTLLVDAD